MVTELRRTYIRYDTTWPEQGFDKMATEFGEILCDNHLSVVYGQFTDTGSHIYQVFDL